MSRTSKVATYQVMPLAEHVGLIEWVDGTTTLRSLIYDEGHAREKWRRQRSGFSSLPAYAPAQLQTR